MPSEHPEIRPRAVLDTGVYVSAAITNGSTRKLIRAAQAGRLTLVVSDKLLAELTDVLHRSKFRRWLSAEDTDEFIQGISLLAEHAADPSMEGRRPVCRDPKDEYLVALAEATEATFLVSGDDDLLAIERGGVSVRTPQAVLDELAFRHPWGEGLLPGRANEALRQAESEGHQQVLRVVFAFFAIVEQSDATALLPALVTPESLDAWVKDLSEVRQILAGRGVATRPEYPAPDVAYVKLPQDPGQLVRSYSNKPLEGAVILTLQRRPELADLTQSGGWRVHGVGDYVPVEDLPS